MNAGVQLCLPKQDGADPSLHPFSLWGRRSASGGSRDVSRKRLIVSGDDFGLAESINQGIIDAYRDGILTSASITVPGDVFEDAVERSRDNPGLGIGLHLTLTQENPLLPAERVPSLVAPDGRMPQNPHIFVRKYLAGRIKPGDVERELRAQFEKALAVSLSLTHFDSHGHIHMWPPIFNMTIRLAQEYRLPSIRYPRELIKARHLAVSGRRRLVLQGILNTLCIWSRRRLETSSPRPITTGNSC